MNKLSRTVAGVAIASCALVLWFGPALAATKKPIAERNFELRKGGSDQLEFPLGETGTITVRAHVKEPAASTPIRLLLEGPGDVQLKKTGPAPLKLRHPLAYPSQQGRWRATVVNVSKIGRVTGKLRVFFEPDVSEQDPESEEEDDAETPAPRAVSAAPAARAGAAAPKALRAVCRDKNRDVSVRLDPASGTGALMMSSHHVFSLESSYVSENVIEMKGNGEHPLYLDREREAIYFRSGEKGEFCKVRIDEGES